LPETSTDGTAAARKADLRRLALARREALPASVRTFAAERIAALVVAVIEEFPSSATVAGFWPIRSEIDPRPALERLAVKGRTLALPALVDGETMVFRRWSPGEALVAAAFGLSEPPPAAAPVDPDILLVPLAAFDRRGGRIGYGGGYYDRAIARLEATKSCYKIGLAYAAQEVERVPEEAHDRRLDLVLTEAGPVFED